MQEYKLFSVQGMPVLPILDARTSGFDWYMILEASGIRWTQCYGWKRPPRLISVLEFFGLFFKFCVWFAAQYGVQEH